MKTDFKLFPSTALFKLLMVMLVSSANKVVKGFALTFEYLMINGRSLCYEHPVYTRAWNCRQEVEIGICFG
jgi:hypothetical protein